MAGCGSGAPAAAPAKTVTVTPSAPDSTAPASPGTPAASPAAGSTATAGAAPAACPTRSLAVKAGLSQGAAGSIYQVLDFSNISNATCTLYGFPGVSLAGGSPVKQIGLAAAEDHSSARVLVTLAPGAVANALLRIVQAANFPPSRCHLVNSDYLQIYPPNQTTPAYLKYKAAGLRQAGAGAHGQRGEARVRRKLNGPVRGSPAQPRGDRRAVRTGRATLCPSEPAPDDSLTARRNEQMPTTPLRQRPAWKALEQHYAEIGPRHLRDLFAADPGRGERLTAEAAGLYLDYSKNRVTDETMALLVQLAQECGVEQRRDAMFRGEPINVSEHRPCCTWRCACPGTAR